MPGRRYHGRVRARKPLVNPARKPPARLTSLIDTGFWPLDDADCRIQNSFPTMYGRVPSGWAFEDEDLYLYRPPFRSVARHASSGVGWRELPRATRKNLRATLVIGDFGLGSDSLIFIDFNTSPSSVKRLTTWGQELRLCDLAKTFDAFADQLALEQVDWSGLRARQATADADQVQRSPRPWWRFWR